MLGLEDRVDDDLFGFEIAQVDHGEAGIGLVVDEQELAVVLALGFGDRRVVRVAQVMSLPSILPWLRTALSSRRSRSPARVPG